MQYKKYDNKNWVTLSIMSISACAISLYFQIFYGYYLIKLEDWSALMDTQGAVAYVASVLLIVTLILNAITMIVYCNRPATILNIYALMYMIGLYNSVKFLPHYFKGDKLIIRLGFQSSVEIDVDNIESISKAKESEFGVKIPKSTYYSLIKVNSPDFELSLKKPEIMKSSYGQKQYVDTVIFQADKPFKMIEKIRSNNESLLMNIDTINEGSEGIL